MLREVPRQIPELPPERVMSWGASNALIELPSIVTAGEVGISLAGAPKYRFQGIAS